MLQKLPKDSRPREKLIKHGPASLSDAELLSVILRTGTKKRDVINLAQDLIEQFGGLAGLLGSEYAEFCTFSNAFINQKQKQGNKTAPSF